jgi:hypothetical protein
MLLHGPKLDKDLMFPIICLDEKPIRPAVDSFAILTNGSLYHVIYVLPKLPRKSPRSV